MGRKRSAYRGKKEYDYDFLPSGLPGGFSYKYSYIGNKIYKEVNVKWQRLNSNSQSWKRFPVT